LPQGYVGFLKLKLKQQNYPEIGQELEIWTVPANYLVTFQNIEENGHLQLLLRYAFTKAGNRTMYCRVLRNVSVVDEDTKSKQALIDFRLTEAEGMEDRIELHIFQHIDKYFSGDYSPCDHFQDGGSLTSLTLL
jgi:hypothetical protein